MIQKDGNTKAIEIENCTFDPSKSLGEGLVKCPSEFINFSLGSNICYTFGGGRSTSLDIGSLMPWLHVK